MIVAVDRRAEESFVWGYPQSHERADGTNAIEPRQLFAFFAAPRVVVNRDLVDSVSEPQRARRNVGLDVKAGSAKAEPSPEIRSDDFVAGLHVGDVAIEEHVCH